VLEVKVVKPEEEETHIIQKTQLPGEPILMLYPNYKSTKDT
jgi:hypothetical protein